MNGQQRGRSPSTGRQDRIRHTPSPSPHRLYQPNAPSLGLEQTLASDPNTFNTALSAQLPPTSQAFDLSPQYLFPNHQPSNIAQHTFLQAQGIDQQSSPGFHFGQQANLFLPNQFNSGNTPASNSRLDARFFSGNNISQEDSIDPSFILDPQLFPSQPLPDQSIDPSSLSAQMATTQTQVPTPPHLLQPSMQRHATPSPHASPALPQANWTPSHSRHTSLDPSSAAFPQGSNADWGPAFQGHRKAPSDTLSDISSHPSPNLYHSDSYDPEQPSPLLSAQQDPPMFSGVNFDQFSLSENGVQQAHISPRHSPHISPNLLPQRQSLPSFRGPDSFGLTPNTNSSFNGAAGANMFPGQSREAFPALLHHSESLDMGQADQMLPPEISIQLAPPSRQGSFEPPKPDREADALSPPLDRSESPQCLRLTDHANVP